MTEQAQETRHEQGSPSATAWDPNKALAVLCDAASEHLAGAPQPTERDLRAALEYLEVAREWLAARNAWIHNNIDETNFRRAVYRARTQIVGDDETRVLAEVESMVRLVVGDPDPIDERDARIAQLIREVRSDADELARVFFDGQRTQQNA